MEITSNHSTQLTQPQVIQDTNNKEVSNTLTTPNSVVGDFASTQSNSLTQVVSLLFQLISVVLSLLLRIVKTQPKVAGKEAQGTAQTSGAVHSSGGSSNQFLWKPISDSDGKLAVLLPSSLTGKVSGVKITSPNGTSVLEQGRFSGVGNGDREHYRFSKAGGSYPDGTVVIAQLKDGTEERFVISNTSARVTKG